MSPRAAHPGGVEGADGAGGQPRRERSRHRLPLPCAESSGGRAAAFGESPARWGRGCRRSLGGLTPAARPPSPRPAGPAPRPAPAADACGDSPPARPCAGGPAEGCLAGGGRVSPCEAPSRQPLPSFPSGFGGSRSRPGGSAGGGGAVLPLSAPLSALGSGWVSDGPLGRAGQGGRRPRVPPAQADPGTAAASPLAGNWRGTGAAGARAAPGPWRPRHPRRCGMW